MRGPGLLVAGLLAVTVLSAAVAQDRGPQIGHPAPGVMLDRLGGGRLDLAELRGRPVLINFWATWCAPCLTEMPELISRWKRHRELGLEVLAVNLSDQERRKDIGRFVEDMGIPFPVLLDRRGRVRERYALSALPTTVFLDSNGIVRAIHPGPLSKEALTRGLALILPP